MTLGTGEMGPARDDEREPVAMDKQSGWFVGCGSCGGNAAVRNCAIVRDKTCEHCEGYGAGPEIDSLYVLDHLVSTELGWCGCGSPERIDALMLAFLSTADGTILRRPTDMAEDTWLLLAYLADEHGWTEHGGSIHGAWLTEDGIEARDNLRRWADA